MVHTHTHPVSCLLIQRKRNAYLMLRTRSTSSSRQFCPLRWWWLQHWEWGNPWTSSYTVRIHWLPQTVLFQHTSEWGQMPHSLGPLPGLALIPYRCLFSCIGGSTYCKEWCLFYIVPHVTALHTQCSVSYSFTTDTVMLLHLPLFATSPYKGSVTPPSSCEEHYWSLLTLKELTPVNCHEYVSIHPQSWGQSLPQAAAGYMRRI